MIAALLLNSGIGGFYALHQSRIPDKLMDRTAGLVIPSELDLIHPQISWLPNLKKEKKIYFCNHKELFSFASKNQK